MRTGIYVANVTPFHEDADYSVDLGAYRAHVAWLAEQGVSGVVPFGTNGEGPSVSADEEVAVVTSLCEDGPDIDLVPGVTEGNLPGTLALLERLNDLPLAGVLVLPPYYFKPVGIDGLRAFYDRVLEVSAHPVLAYHIPMYSVPVPAELVVSLPLWGVKNSSGDASWSDRVREGGKHVMVGTEGHLAQDLRGAHGAILGLANVVPDQLVELHRRVQEGDDAGARVLAEHVAGLVAMTQEHDSPAVLKAVAQARHGIAMGTVRPPLRPLPASYDVASRLARLEPVAAS